MIPGFGFWPSSPLVDQKVFTINSDSASGQVWQQWQKPKGKSMCTIFILGSGGGGGNGVVGVNSNAAGGGGGGSSSQGIFSIPMSFLPDVLYVLVGLGGTTAADSFVCIAPKTTANGVVATAAAGGGGSSGSGGTHGNGGSGGSFGAATSMPLGFGFLVQSLNGQSGTNGGDAAAGANLTLPVTGIRTTGGTGGGGLPGAAATGSNGGDFTVPAVPMPFPAHLGGIGPSVATNPAVNGASGYPIDKVGFYFYGGTGGSSTHGTALTTGLVGANGGTGSFGCGGGGAGGALTTSTAGVRGQGGPGLVVITSY